MYVIEYKANKGIVVLLLLLSQWMPDLIESAD